MSPEEQREERAAAHSSILQLYRRLQTGMTSNEVRAVLGPPTIFLRVSESEGIDEAWYGRRPERKMSPYESPYAFGDIGATYRDGRLTKKQYNGQHLSEQARKILESP